MILLIQTKIEAFSGPVIINKMNKCPNVTPENVYFIDFEQVKAQIAQQYNAKEKAIYFANHTYTSSEFCKMFNISQEGVAVSFSKDEKLNQYHFIDLTQHICCQSFAEIHHQ